MKRISEYYLLVITYDYVLYNVVELIPNDKHDDKSHDTRVAVSGHIDTRNVKLKGMHASPSATDRPSL